MPKPEDPIKCPCCGQVVPGGKVRVDLNEGILSYNGRAIHMSKRLAELAFILARRMPETVAKETIIAQMWGDAEPDWAVSNAGVAICALRKRIEHIGLRVVTNYNRGFSLEEVQRTERTNSQPTGVQHAQA